ITGGDGKDTLYGDDGDDVLTGGLDDDLIYGGDGDDTFVYNLGDGFDVYRESLESETDDRILFGSGITSGDLSFTRLSNNDLQIDINVVGNEGTIIIENQFNPTTSLGFIETIEFSDTSTLDLSTINHTFTATDQKEILYGVNNGSGGIVDTIYGEGGNDQITGYFGADTLHGGDGDDTIYGGSQTISSTYSQETASNTLYGNAGNDYLQGSYGTDYLYGGTGNDTLIGNEGDDEYYFELNGGNDTIDEVDQSDTDTIFFGAGIYEEDLSFVREGALSLRINIQGGLGGSILIVNQFGTTHADAGIEYVELDDTTQIYLPTLNYGLYGTSANETLVGLDNATDIIFGEGGNDTIIGQTGADELHGGDGDDTLYGGGSGSPDLFETDTNYLYGNAGEDSLYGAYGTDHIYGGADDDYLAGTKGTDHYYFFRGEGDDTIEDKYTDATDDTIHFGSTISVSDITYERSGTADLKILINAGYGGSILLKNQFVTGSTYGVVEYLSFTDTTTVDLRTVNMTTYGTASGEYLYDVEHNAGEDGTIYAGDGNDNLYGDDGEDTLYGEGGNDNLYGENDDDLLIGGDGNDLLRGGYGNDILRGGLGDDTLDGDQNTDTADYSQSATAVIIDLEDGDATGEGTDTLIEIENATGSAFDDTFITDNYANYVDGGDGSDTLDYSQTLYAAYSITINLATGVTTGSGTSDTFINIENVIGRAGGDNITGNDAANKLEGRNGTDTISGAGGNDLIYGGDGSDTLSGGDGDDVLYGGNGADSMTGGNGADIFTFLSGETGTKTITDFTTGDGDALDISDLLALYDPMTDLLTDFVEITDSGSNSTLRVDVDGGADSFVSIATLTGVTGLTDEDALEAAGNLIAVAA
ncbi:MAG: type I secretion C-terminal target domain-containing protein, partial [Rhodobacteraceae bacterium]|nr:type I secretion C-terminal target domain-containing protein [Paracoccaceae bacterium]